MSVVNFETVVEIRKILCHNQCFGTVCDILLARCLAVGGQTLEKADRRAQSL